MKKNGKGILIILVALLLIPLFADLVFSIFLPKTMGGLGTTWFHLSGILSMLPFYLIYLVIAYIVIHYYDKYQKSRRSKE